MSCVTLSVSQAPAVSGLTVVMIRFGSRVTMTLLQRKLQMKLTSYSNLVSANSY